MGLVERRLAWPGLGFGAIRYQRLRQGGHADGGSGEHGGRRCRDVRLARACVHVCVPSARDAKRAYRAAGRIESGGAHLRDANVGHVHVHGREMDWLNLFYHGIYARRPLCAVYPCAP